MQEDRKRFDKASLVYDQVVFNSENFIHHIEVCTIIFFFISRFFSSLKIWFLVQQSYLFLLDLNIFIYSWCLFHLS